MIELGRGQITLYVGLGTSVVDGSRTKMWSDIKIKERNSPNKNLGVTYTLRFVTIWSQQ